MRIEHKALTDEYDLFIMQKDKEMDMFSFSKSIARCLKKYIADGSKATVSVCTNCGAENTIIYQEGCQTCTSCGFGVCG